MMAILARLAASQRVRVGLACVGLALFAIIAVRVWLHNHDASVIERHEEKITKQVDAATDAANATANANDAVRQVKNARADAQLRGAITDAQAEHPEETRRAAGPAVSGTLDRLRERQAAARAAASQPR